AFSGLIHLMCFHAHSKTMPLKRLPPKRCNEAHTTGVSKFISTALLRRVRSRKKGEHRMNSATSHRNRQAQEVTQRRLDPVNLKAKRANYRHMLSIPFISVVRQSLATLLALAILSTQFFVGGIRANAQQPSDQELSGQNHSGKRLPDEQELAMQREALNSYG